MAPDFGHTVTLRPKRRGLRHLMLAGSMGQMRTLCGIQCDGWVVSPDAPDCRRCIAVNEINNLRAVEETSERIRGHNDFVCFIDECRDYESPPDDA